MINEGDLFVVAGDGRLVDAIIERLEKAALRVVHIQGGGGKGPAPEHLDGAKACLLAQEDDSGNVDLALTLRGLKPDLPLVVRLFDGVLSSYLKETLTGTTVLSMSAISAPRFAEALDQTIRARPAMASTLVPAPPGETRRASRGDRVVTLAILGLLALVVVAAWFFSRSLGLRFVDGLYFVWTTVMTVGYGDISLKDASDHVKFAGMALMLLGAGFMAILFASLTAWVVEWRERIAHGRVRVRGTGHIVLVGGGNTGFRVAERLREIKHRVVVIESDPQGRRLEALRRAGHHVIVADATADSVLDLAGVGRAAGVMALTDSDAVNLHVALLVRAARADLPLVLRVESPELSAHVARTRDAIALSPLAIAADEFVAAARSAAKNVH